MHYSAGLKSVAGSSWEGHQRMAARGAWEPGPVKVTIAPAELLLTRDMIARISRGE
jgi:hypothetical protein